MLPSETAFLRRYPHQLSGGQQQRVAIAMAFATRPKVIVCDEPTTGLDVTTQSKVLETLRDLCRTHRVAALYVSHDLAVVAELADHVAVMYAGRIVEAGPHDALFGAPRAPLHPPAAARRARHGRRARGRRHPRLRPAARPPPGRLRVRPPLLAGRRSEPRAVPAGLRARRRAQRALLAHRGGGARDPAGGALGRPTPPPARACSPSPASTPTTATTTCCTRSGSRSTAASACRWSASRAAARRRWRAASPGCTRTTPAR